MDEGGGEDDFACLPKHKAWGAKRAIKGVVVILKDKHKGHLSLGEVKESGMGSLGLVKHSPWLEVGVADAELVEELST